MIIYCLRKLVKLLRLNAAINRDYDDSIIFELWRKKGDKLSIDFYPLWQLDKFVFYRKLKSSNDSYKYIETELPWLLIYYMNFYD